MVFSTCNNNDDGNDDRAVVGVYYNTNIDIYIYVILVLR